MFSGMFYCPGGPNFRQFRSTGHRLQVTVNFSCDGGGGSGGDNSETNVLNGESEYVQLYLLLPRGPTFSPVSLYEPPLACYSQFYL